MLKLESTLPNLAKICLLKSTTPKFCPFAENDKDLLEKIREDMGGGPSIVFTKKVVVDETSARDSTNWCKSIVGIDASQLCYFFICQAMPIGLYTRWELDSESEDFGPRQNKTMRCENMIISYFRRVRPQCVKWKVSMRLVHRKKLRRRMLMAFVDSATLCLNLWDGISLL